VSSSARSATCKPSGRGGHQRVTTENTTLKQRVRQLTADNRTLDERSSRPLELRLQDRRVADLEACIANPETAT